ncbi:MAG TPA: 4Fe-4S binding protein [Methanoregula sp.]|nr:4Fe-4S binding protein [Methanoregula sp.]
MPVIETLKRNKWRYLSLLAGFFLFVGPFALVARGVNFLTGNLAASTLHTLCIRMPVSSLFQGQILALLGSVAGAFVLGIIIISFFFGPVFCGWACPVGAVSEGVSRAVPLPERYRLRIRDPGVTKGLRYGFFAGFIAVALLVGYQVASVSSICCRYCTSSVLQNLVDGLTGQVTAVAYWHTGSLLTLFSWLLVGGVFMSGGRGWCLFFCPLGTLSGISHTLGKKFGMYRIFFNEKKCAACAECRVSCPTWAQGKDRKPDSHLCIACKECTTACPNGSYEYRRGEPK